MELLVALSFFVLFLLAMLIPSWVIILVYDYIAVQLGWVTLEVTFWNVVCVAILLAVLKGIFGSSKK